jgi:hypothetical protein
MKEGLSQFALAMGLQPGCHAVRQVTAQMNVVMNVVMMRLLRAQQRVNTQDINNL